MSKRISRTAHDDAPLSAAKSPDAKAASNGGIAAESGDVQIGRSVTIDRPRMDLYRFWRHFEAPMAILIPTTTHGKHAAKAKALELAGWDYPRHLEGRSYSLVVHGDAAGAQTLRRSLSDWLNDMRLLEAGAES